MNTDPPQEHPYALLPDGPRTRYRGSHPEPPPVAASGSNHGNGVGGMASQVARSGGKGRETITSKPGGVDVYMKAQSGCRMVRQVEQRLTLIANSQSRFTPHWLVGETKERD